MKAESTVQRMMSELFRTARNEDLPKQVKHEAYQYATALQWVVQKTDWNPMSLLRSETMERSK